MKFTIVIPYSSASWGISPSWAAALRQLNIPGQYNIHMLKGYPIDTARNYGVKLALEEKSDYVLMLDADVIPESPDALVALLQWRLPVVSGIYALKRPTAGGGGFPLNLLRKEGKEYRPLTYGDAPKGHRLVEADGCGAGFLLVAREVFEKLQEPWFKWEIIPWLPQEGQVSEDIYFGRRLREELDIPTFGDLSVTCLHQLAPGLALNTKGEIVTVI